MIDPITVIFFLAIAFVISFPLFVSEKTLGRVMSLHSLDKAWDKRFEDVEDRDIYVFWDTVVYCLGYDGKKRPASKPTATIQDVYRVVHPDVDTMDAKELQYFIHTIKEKYRVDLTGEGELWEMELGNLFARILAVRKGSKTST